jgi:hypothetical protein
MARTFYQRCASGPVSAIHGNYHEFADCALTNDATTTAELDIRGLSHGSVENHTGSAITITWYASMTKGGTAHALKDQDGVAVTSVVAADHTVQELPSALAGVAFAVPVSDAATDTVSFHFER